MQAYSSSVSSGTVLSFAKKSFLARGLPGSQACRPMLDDLRLAIALRGALRTEDRRVYEQELQEWELAPGFCSAIVIEALSGPVGQPGDEKDAYSTCPAAATGALMMRRAPQGVALALQKVDHQTCPRVVLSAT